MLESSYVVSMCVICPSGLIRALREIILFYSITLHERWSRYETCGFIGETVRDYYLLFHEADGCSLDTCLK